MSARIDGRVARSVRAQARRDQVAAALRDVERPVRKGELKVNSYWFRGCTDGSRHGSNDFWSHYDDGVDVRVDLAPPEAADLAVLARDGLAAREKVEGQGRGAVYWSWIGEPVDMSSVAHLDFEARSGIDMMIEDLTALGAELERIADPIKSEVGLLYAASIEWRQNGPVRYFRVELWEGAPADSAASAIREAIVTVLNPGQAKRRGAFCLGSPVAIDLEG